MPEAVWVILFFFDSDSLLVRWICFDPWLDFTEAGSWIFFCPGDLKLGQVSSGHYSGKHKHVALGVDLNSSRRVGSMDDHSGGNERLGI